MKPYLPLITLMLLASQLPLAAHADETIVVPDSSPRVTETVKLVRRCLPSVVAIRTLSPTANPKQMRINAGSGSLIHPAGYVITNEHVVGNALKGEVLFWGQKWRPFKIVGRLPEDDIALLKVELKEERPALSIGRSHDIMLGEPAYVIGNPTGLVHTLSTGVVSGINRNTTTEHAFLPEMIQTSAAVSGGSSGGPLINAEGFQIGMITSRKTTGSNLGFAIAADRIRKRLPTLLDVEVRCGYRIGIEMDMLAPNAVIATVAKDSSAAQAGLQAGDGISKIDSQAVADGVDFWLQMLERKPGTMLNVEVTREDKPVAVTVRLQPLPPLEPVKPDVAKGVVQERFRGSWPKLPDFAKLQAEAQEIVPALQLKVPDDWHENFAVRYSGFFDARRTGVYFFAMGSDDGSRLTIGDRVVINNDGLHSNLKRSGIVHLEAGLHPLELVYFQQGGDYSLDLHFQPPNQFRLIELPPNALFHLTKKQPDETKPDQTKPDQTKPDQTKPDQTKPDQTKRGGNKPKAADQDNGEAAKENAERDTKQDG